jgi:adenylate cyclase class 2
MLEVEVKARLEDKASLVARLNLLGAVYTGKLEEKDIYFNHPCRDFRQTDEALRLRTVTTGKTAPEQIFLTYKGKKLGHGVKSREEFTVQLRDEEGIQNIFKKLGFKEVGVVKKARELFKLGEISVCIDQVSNLGTFVEIEIVQPAENFKNSKRRILSLLDKLGINPSQIVEKTYLELILELIL